MFAVTNIDDILLLALYFGQAGHDRAAVARVVAGQYLGFAAILVTSVAGADEPDRAISFLATRPLVARALSRWGHVVLPVALITIGVLILVGG